MSRPTAKELEALLRRTLHLGMNEDLREAIRAAADALAQTEEGTATAKVKRGRIPARVRDVIASIRGYLTAGDAFDGDLKHITDADYKAFCDWVDGQPVEVAAPVTGSGEPAPVVSEADAEAIWEELRKRLNEPDADPAGALYFVLHDHFASRPASRPRAWEDRLDDGFTGYVEALNDRGGLDTAKEIVDAALRAAFPEYAPTPAEGR